MRRHGGIRADGNDPIAGDGDRLRYRESGIDRYDLAVLENDVSGRDDRSCWDQCGSFCAVAETSTSSER